MSDFTSFDSYFLNGFQVFDNMLTMSELCNAQIIHSQWINTVPLCILKDFKKNHYGIIKDCYNGQNAFSWYVRTIPKILDLFSTFWGDHNLICSMERSYFGTCDEMKRKGCYSAWEYDDDYAGKGGVRAYAFITSNHESGFTYIPNSHRYDHNEHSGLGKKDFVKNYSRREGTFLPMVKGSVVLFNPSLVHCMYTCKEPLLAQPLSFCPKKMLTENSQYKRLSGHIEKRSTTYNCIKTTYLKRGSHESTNPEYVVDDFYDTVYIDHPLRNKLI